MPSDRAYHTEWMRNWRRNDPRGPMLVSARARAKEKGLDFRSIKDDIHIPNFCPVLGIPIRPNSGRHDDNSHTLDRLYPNHGYVPWNVRVISYRANNLKSNMTLEECILILRDLEDRI